MKSEKQLYQWDVNQYLTELQPTAEFVDYPIGNEVIRLETDGTRCRIPDEVLQTYGGKTCYERYSDGTFRAYSFSVLYAPKPPDYVYTAEERTTFDALVAKADAAIAEIKRRADSGEFTPKKGVDYFTDAEKAEMMESVSSGAVGEFREVVDTATTEYNVNHTEKMTAYDTNASEKLTTYDTNAEQHTTDYNRNDAEKLETYNQNHAAKVAEYNQNAETKTAEFDANAAALQTEVDRLRGECDTLAAEKANVDGYYEEMTVGDAEQLISTQFVEDNEPYLFRPTGGPSDVGNRAYLDKIVGGTVAWNQQLKLDRVNNDDGITASLNNDRSITINGTATSDAIIRIDSRNAFKLDENHKYLYKGCPSGGSGTRYFLGDSWNNVGIDYGSGTIFTATSVNFQPSIIVREGNTVSNLTFKPSLFDLTQMFGSTIADYIYSLEQSQAGAGVAWFKKLFPNDYYAYNAGELLSVEGLQSHNTVGFNQWDEEWEVGYISQGEPSAANNCIRSKNFCPCIGGSTYYVTCGKTDGGSSNSYYVGIYWYDVDKNFISRAYSNNLTSVAPSNARYFKIGTNTATVVYGNTYNHDICINLSDPSRNGEYEPYEKHSYPLDSSLTLRGIPKLDASNNLYYDGDEYASDGKVKRKYGVVDLGTLNWVASTGLFCARLTNFAIPSSYNSRKEGFIFSNKYSADTQIAIDASKMTDKTSLRINGYIYIKDTAYTDAATFKEAMSGVMLVYELATPTTETAEPFQHIQIVDDFGTDEFVSTGIVPVGHKTRYPANLRDKLQHLPSLASADGTYLIQQSGKQMSLIHMPAVFPETPTEDGTYTLKTVVTGGVATLQWVVE